MPSRSSAVSAAAVLAILCAPAPALGGGYRPGDPPALCSGPAFADQIGTDRRERMQAARRPERLWGLGGADVLLGSATRAACLFGGDAGDVLSLGTGGGAAYGESGSDALTGDLRDDVLRGGEGDDSLTGGAGGDTLDGGTGRDAITAGDGDDTIDAADGRAEVVDCGGGEDLVAADRTDALIGCESAAVAGPAAARTTRAAVPAGAGDIVRLRFTVPEAAGAGAYRVLLIDGCLAGTEIARVGARVKTGRRVRIGLRPPAQGWCAGTHRAAVVLGRECPRRRRCVAPPPLEPVARLDFRVG